MGGRNIRSVKAFTLVELVVVVSIIGLVMAMMLPALGRARGQAKAVICASNVRQLGIAWTCYAGDYDGFAMPGAETSKNTYWWGKVLPDGIDHKEGFIQPYLKSGLKEGGVYECPAQCFGSYGLQGKPATEPDDKKWITSTYGYNGYYLSPPQSGWPDTEDRPWQKTVTIKGPDKVFAFADTLIEWPGLKQPLNTFLLDPPDLYNKDTGYWFKNSCPTTCFRHNDKTNVVFVDGHCGSVDLEGAAYVSPAAKIGSVGVENSPHYVPDWREWPANGGGRRRH